MIGLTEYAFPYCGEKYPLAKKLEKRYDQDFNDKNYTNVAMAYNTMLFLREAIRKAGSTDTEKMVKALEGLEVDTALGRIKVLEYSHQGVVPIFIGTTAFTAAYPFAVLKDIKVYQGEKIMISENEIRKMRGE